MCLFFLSNEKNYNTERTFIYFCVFVYERYVCIYIFVFMCYVCM